MVLNGKVLAEKLKDEIKDAVSKENLNISLCVVTVGDDPASKVYVNQKKKACEYCGMKFTNLVLPESISSLDFIDEIKKAVNSDYTGIIVQQPTPLPSDVMQEAFHIIGNKDVDGFNDYKDACTPKGIVKMLEYYDVPLAGKKVVIIGRSYIVGKPLAMQMLDKDATVTLCHSKTKPADLENYIRGADIVVAAVGKPKFLKGELLTERQVVVDVGINRVKDDSEKGYHIEGDYDGVNKDKIFGYTPVPNGVGAMTVVSLIRNLYDKARL